MARLDDVHRELAEIDENLIRVELTKLEFDEHLARRKELYEALHPDTKRGAKGIKKMNSNLTPDSGVRFEPSFVDDTAAKTGKSKAAIHEAIQIATSLDEETKAAVRGTSIEDKQTATRQGYVERRLRLEVSATRRPATDQRALTSGYRRALPQFARPGTWNAQPNTLISLVFRRVTDAI